MKRISLAMFHGAVGAYAILLVCLSIIPIKAQPRTAPSSLTDYRIETLDDRIRSIESLGLDRRLVVIETTLKSVESGTTWNQLTMGGIGLLLARAVYEAISGRRLKKELES